MTNKELRQKEVDLEQQLEQQLGVLKNESKIWVKYGGAALAGGLLTYGIAKTARGKKKKKAEKLIDNLEKQGKIDRSHCIKTVKKNKSSLMGSFGKRLFFVLLSLGQAKLIDEFSKRAHDAIKK